MRYYHCGKQVLFDNGQAIVSLADACNEQTAADIVAALTFSLSGAAKPMKLDDYRELKKLREWYRRAGHPPLSND